MCISIVVYENVHLYVDMYVYLCPMCMYMLYVHVCICTHILYIFISVIYIIIHMYIPVIFYLRIFPFYNINFNHTCLKILVTLFHDLYFLWCQFCPRVCCRFWWWPVLSFRCQTYSELTCLALLARTLSVCSFQRRHFAFL